MEIKLPSKIKVSRTFVEVLVVIVVAVISFYGGTRYEKHRQPAVPKRSLVGQGTTNPAFGDQFNRRSRIFRQTLVGKVTTVSTTSITVQGNNDNASHTYSISSTTAITNNGQTAAVTDIQTGDNVLVVASPADASQALSILINPTVDRAPAPATN